MKLTDAGESVMAKNPGDDFAAEHAAGKPKAKPPRLPAQKRLEKMTVEETFEELDRLIDRLESGEGSLEDAFQNYETGMKLVKSCNQKIDKIEKQVLVLGGDAGSLEESEDVSF